MNTNIKNSNVSQRLNQLIRERNLRQVDVLKMCERYSIEYGVKISKGDLSTYVSGKAEPRENKLFILAKAFDVSEAWLMGFDVPQNNNDIKHNNSVPIDTNIEIELIKNHIIRKVLSTEIPINKVKEIDSYIDYILNTI